MYNNNNNKRCVCVCVGGGGGHFPIGRTREVNKQTNKIKKQKQNSRDMICVVVRFYPRFKFYFPLFWGYCN